MIIRWVAILSDLTKIKISLLVTFSALVSFSLAKQSITWEGLLPLAGIFFLACGACGLNQVQERDHDQLMKRTANRPIPSKRLSPQKAFFISSCFLFLGLLLLLIKVNWIKFGLGIFAIFWYLGIYTPLKKRTPLAVIPGALIGTIPPLMGWLSGGGHLRDPKIYGIFFFFYIWQIPHFWLLLFNYRKDYERAGFPSLEWIFTPIQIKRVLFSWIFATGVSAFIIPLFDMVRSPMSTGGVLGMGGWLCWKAFKIFGKPIREDQLRSLFIVLNLYGLLIMVCLGMEPFVRTFVMCHWSGN